MTAVDQFANTPDRVMRALQRLITIKNTRLTLFQDNSSNIVKNTTALMPFLFGTNPATNIARLPSLLLVTDFSFEFVGEFAATVVSSNTVTIALQWGGVTVANVEVDTPAGNAFYSITVRATVLGTGQVQFTWEGATAPVYATVQMNDNPMVNFAGSLGTNNGDTLQQVYMEVQR